MADFNVHFEKSNFDVRFVNGSNDGIDIVFGEVQTVTVADPYQGEYIATPKTTQQTLPTMGKVMADNVTILEIPYFDVSNPSGGKTIYIANEV